MLGSDSLQCQHNNITHRLDQKLPSPEKYYLCFQMDRKTARAAECSKSRAWTKVIGLILDIHSFDLQYVIIKVFCSRNN